MKKISYLLILISLINIKANDIVINTSVGFYNDPIGVASDFLFFSWKVNSQNEKFYQKAYQIIISDNYEATSKNIGNIFNSGKVNSSKSIINLINFRNFIPAKKYYWKVKIWDKNNKCYSSNVSYFVVSLKKDDWKHAKWISYEILDDSLKVFPGVHGGGKNLGNKALKRSIIPYFRKEFIVKKEIKEAYLFIASPGHYEAFINGNRIGNFFLTPSWTNYKKRIYFNSYEVTEYLKDKNCLGIIAGNGFYYINRERYRKLTIAEGYPTVIAKLIIRYTDNSFEEILTDETWKTTSSPIVYSSIYGGEDYDARLEQKDWNYFGYDDSIWKNVVVNTKLSIELLYPEIIYPVTYKEEFSPINIWRINEQTFVYDFGQNMSGIINIIVRGNEGDQIKITPAELIFDNKEVNQRNSGRPYYWTYILKRNTIESWKPSFSYYGYRYAQIEVFWADSSKKYLSIDSIKSIHISNSALEVGDFKCSNELFNKTYKLIKWAIKSNMQNVLTDCPHREKLGWLEQTYLMGSAIHYNFNIYHLYNKIIYDMIDSQQDNGLIPCIAPEYVIFDDVFRDSPEWGSASIILPYLVYKWYGDTNVLKRSWNMMNKYFDYLSSKANNHILNYGLGDWYDLGPQKPGFAQLTPISLTATATYYYDACILKEVSKILKEHKLYQKYDIISKNIKNEFNKVFFDSIRAVYSTGSQTAMAMPIALNLVPENYKSKVIKNFVDSIVKNDYKLTAGDIGFYYVLKALTDNGYADIVYKMNNRDDVPGYGYQLKKGATALTESWQALETVSNNHLMLGHLMDWFYYALAGIKQELNSVAYRNILLEPCFINDISYVNVYFDSPHGKIISNWERLENILKYHIKIPENTTAKVKINKKYVSQILRVNNKKIKNIKETENYFIINLNSGKYLIEMIKN